MGSSIDFVISSSFFFFFFFFFFRLSARIEVGAIQQDDCMESRCNQYGPAVRFPFWLRDYQPDHCGYPGPEFILSCTDQNDTVLELPFSVNLFVENIDYEHQEIHVYDPDHCLPKQLPNLSLSISASPFQFLQNYVTNYTLFNCSSDATRGYGMTSISCLSFPAGYQVYSVLSIKDIQEMPLSSCSKIRTIRSVPYNIFETKKNDLHLTWSKPMCRNCEASGKHCRLKNSTETETECFGISERSQRGKGITLL